MRRKYIGTGRFQESKEFFDVTAAEEPGLPEVVARVARAATSVVAALAAVGVELLGADCGAVPQSSPTDPACSVDLRLRYGRLYMIAEAKFSWDGGKLAQKLQEAIFERDSKLLRVATEPHLFTCFTKEGTTPDQKRDRVRQQAVGALAVTEAGWALHATRLNGDILLCEEKAFPSLQPNVQPKQAQKQELRQKPKQRPLVQPRPKQKARKPAAAIKRAIGKPKIKKKKKGRFNKKAWMKAYNDGPLRKKSKQMQESRRKYKRVRQKYWRSEEAKAKTRLRVAELRKRQGKIGNQRRG